MGPLPSNIAGFIALHGSRLVSWSGKIYGKQPGDPVENLNVNLAIWGMFMNTTLRAAVHLGKDYDTSLRFVKNYLWKTTGQLFRETQKLISGQTETTGVSLIYFPRYKVGIDMLIAQSSLSICHCHGLCLLRLCGSVWEKWETILLNPGRSKFNGIQTTIS